MIHQIRNQRPLLAALSSQVASLDHAIRTDALRSADEQTHVLRASLRGYALQTARQVARNRADSGLRTDEREIDDLARYHVERAASALGLREVDGQITRNDSVALSGELTARDPSPIRRPETPYPLSAMIPRRNVDAGAERATRITVTGSGSAGLVRAGSTDIPTVDVDAAEDGPKILMAAVQTVRPWGSELASARMMINEEAEKLQQAGEAHRIWREDLLKSGITGTDAVGIEQLGAPNYSGIDYTASPTMDAIHADWIDWLDSIRQAAEYRGIARWMVLVGPRLASAAFRRPSNYAAGGSSTGRNMADALRSSVDYLRQFGGLDSITEASSLQGLRLGAAYDMAIAIPIGERTVEQIVAIETPTPIYSFDGPMGRATYWVTRHGGLDLPSVINIGTYIAKVSA